MNKSKHEMRLIAKMRRMNVKKSTSKTELFRILERKDKIIYKEITQIAIDIFIIKYTENNTIHAIQESDVLLSLDEIISKDSL